MLIGGGSVGEFSSDLYHALACDIKNVIFFREGIQ